MNARPASRLAGAAMLAVIGAFALFGPVLIESDPLRQNLRAALLPPSAEFLLGTDHLGRSMLARLAHAARLSLGFGIAAVLVAGAIGTTLGTIAAAARGRALDRAISGLCDTTMALPGLLTVVMIAALAPGQLWPLYAGLVATQWVEFYRPVRALAAGRLASPDVEAARLFAFGEWHVFRRHLLPELAPLACTLATFGVASAVLAVSTLSFVGIGLRPPTPELGGMMAELLPHYADAPWQLLAPALLLFATVLGLRLVASGGDAA
ncbi:MAG: ABC transporter permease [Azospirillum sp.]|nr:ABC transporter permease [Azospirillum sp.]